MAQHSKRGNQTPKSPLRKFFKTPKGLAFIMLVVLMGIAALDSSDRSGIWTVLTAVVACLVMDMVVALVRKQRRVLSDGGLVTGLIIGLVLSASTPWYVTAVTSLIAIGSKHVLKMGRKPIFNPAAFGLLFAILVFSTGQSWWGDLADLPVWCIVFVLITGYAVVHRVNKFPQVFSFLGGHFVMLLVAAYFHFGQAAYSPGDAFRNPLINAALFLAFFMLTDPPTSPAKYRDQVWFGLLAAVVSTGVYLLFGGLTYLLIGLLVANGVKAWVLGKRDAANKPKPRVQVHAGSVSDSRVSR